MCRTAIFWIGAVMAYAVKWTNIYSGKEKNVVFVI